MPTILGQWEINSRTTCNLRTLYIRSQALLDLNRYGIILRLDHKIFTFLQDFLRPTGKKDMSLVDLHKL